MIRRLTFVLLALAAFAWSAPAGAQPPSYLFQIPSNFRFHEVHQMVQHPDGRVFVAAGNTNLVVAYDLSGNYVTQFGSGGTGLGQFQKTTGLAIDAAGNFYVSDQFNLRVQKFSPAFVPLGAFGAGTLNNPVNLAIAPDQSRLYVVEYLAHRISMFDLNGLFLGSFGSPGSGAGQFNRPWGIAVDATGQVYVADQVNHRVQQFTATGTYLGQFGTNGSGAGQFQNPVGMDFDSKGDLFVCDQLNNRVQQFTPAGAYLTQWGSFGSGPGQFYNDWCVLETQDGNIWVGDTYNFRIQVFGFPTPAIPASWGAIKSTYRQ
jgi:DNA-binding beta-propeller fold protein YncE